MNSQRIGIAIFLGIGIVLLTIAGFIARSAVALEARAVPVEGVVVGLDDAWDANRDPYFVARVEWTRPDGRKLEHRMTSQSAGTYQKGQRVELLFDPEDPEVPQGTGFGGRWVAVTILGFIGIVFAGIAVSVWRKPRSA